MKITDIKQDTPRLVVEFSRDDVGKERFGWGIVGQVQLMTLTGAIARVQTQLVVGYPEVDECEAMALIVVWDESEMVFTYFVNPHIPVDSLIGMLEMIKTTLVGTQMAQQQAGQAGLPIFGADGRPLPKRR